MEPHMEDEQAFLKKCFENDGNIDKFPIRIRPVKNIEWPHDLL